MSETSKIALGKEVSSLDVSPQFEAYSGVEIIVDEETSYFAGSRNGRVLTIQNEWGTQAQANNILADLQAKGFQYQPYTAGGAIINPAAEIGDGVTIADTYSGIYTISKNFGRLMKSDISAPQDEEVDHEFPYEPKQDRVYKREIAEAHAQIKVNANSISAEVLRATNREDALQSSITQTATEISATVLKKSGGSSSSFGWTLSDSKWELKSNNTTVFKVNSSGAEIKGKITATSGLIGGFTIGQTAIYNGMTSLSSTKNGVYVGTDGIACGGGKFTVTSNGTITTSGIRLKGTLTFLNSDGTTAGTMTAADLKKGAERANSGYSSWNSAYASTSAGGYCYGGAGYGYNFNEMTNNRYTATYLKGQYIYATSNINTPILIVDGTSATWQSKSFRDYDGNQVYLRYLGRS